MTTTLQLDPTWGTRLDEAKKPVLEHIRCGRYDEALVAIRTRFCGQDKTAVPERFPFYLDTWASAVLRGRYRDTTAGFLRELVSLEPDTNDRTLAIWRACNTEGLDPQLYGHLLEHVAGDLNREMSLYVTSKLSESTVDRPRELTKGPLWLVLLLCVCRPTRSGSFGVLAHKRVFTADDLVWIDDATTTAAKHGADLGLANTVTWKRQKPAVQAMVADIEARILRQAADEVKAEQGESVRPSGRARL